MMTMRLNDGFYIERNLRDASNSIEFFIYIIYIRLSEKSFVLFIQDEIRNIL